MHALVGHHGADEDEVSPQQDIDKHQERIGEGNEKRSYREQYGETYNAAAEIVDLRSTRHVEKFKVSCLLLF
jgi:hypothetical protein